MSQTDTDPVNVADHVAGIDERSVTAWLTARTEVTAPVTFALITGGRSNLTVRLDDAAGRSWVLRRPPTVGVLPSAHDVVREHRILAGLAGSDVPVPSVVGACEDVEVTSAPFYVMDHVAGHVIRHGDAVDALALNARRRLSEDLVDVLARLHLVDPTATPLADLGRRDGYLERQLRRLHQQYESGGTRPLPLLTELRDRLAAGLPPQQRNSIVHGDYRLDNVIVSDDGRVAAVLDWELCTLGDPLADLGLLLVYWLEPDDEPIPRLSPPTDQPGFADRGQLLDRYADRTGLDLDAVDVYVGFGYWKLAVILEGVYSRFLAGAYDDDDDTYEAFGAAVPRLLERAASALDKR